MTSPRDIILHEAFASDGIVMAARIGEDPGAGRYRRLLAALRALYDLTKASTAIERDLALALQQLAYRTEFHYRYWQRDGKVLRVELLNHDLPRLATAVESVLEGRWHRPTGRESAHRPGT